MHKYTRNSLLSPPSEHSLDLDLERPYLFQGSRHAHVPFLDACLVTGIPTEHVFNMTTDALSQSAALVLGFDNPDKEVQAIYMSNMPPNKECEEQQLEAAQSVVALCSEELLGYRPTYGYLVGYRGRGDIIPTGLGHNPDNELRLGFEALSRERELAGGVLFYTSRVALRMHLSSTGDIQPQLTQLP